jgi:hypothetical protein
MQKCTTVADEGSDTQKFAKTDAIMVVVPEASGSNGYACSPHHMVNRFHHLLYNNSVCGWHFFQL